MIIGFFAGALALRLGRNTKSLLGSPTWSGYIIAVRLALDFFGIFVPVIFAGWQSLLPSFWESFFQAFAGWLCRPFFLLPDGCYNSLGGTFCVCQLRTCFYVGTFTVIGCASYAVYTTYSFSGMFYFCSFVFFFYFFRIYGMLPRGVKFVVFT